MIYNSASRNYLQLLPNPKQESYVADPKMAYRLQMLGPISSYCALVWHEV